MPGAETRTSRASGLSPLGVVWHHTATGPNWADGHVAALLRDGRRDLAGPLSQVGIERDGTWVIVALGRANHNGYGTWGNDSIGLEFYNSGLGEPWPHEQVESGVVGTAAILTHLGKRAGTTVKAHRETDPKRKPDPTGLDMTAIRQRIDVHLHATTEEFTMDDEARERFISLEQMITWVQSQNVQLDKKLRAIENRQVRRKTAEADIRTTRNIAEKVGAEVEKPEG
jgi:hypothetical protein